MLTIVRLRICSAVCAGSYSALLCEFKIGSSMISVIFPKIAHFPFSTKCAKFEQIIIDAPSENHDIAQQDQDAIT